MSGLENYFARALDPVLLSRACGLEPDGWQAELLRSASKQVLLLCSRQSGKSTITALIALHQAIYKTRSLTLLLSPSYRQSQELFRKVMDFYKMLPENERPLPTQESLLRVELQNGARIISLPDEEEKVRGFSGVNLLIIDEAAFVSNDLYLAVRPMLAVSKGRIIALSTPHGKRGWFYEAWEKGGENWQRFKVSANQCPRIPREFLESEAKAMPAWVYSQEYMCEFKENQSAVFSHDLIQRAISSEVKPLNLFERSK